MWKRVLNISHLYVAILTLILLWIGSMVVMNISFFDPIKRALSNFSLSDIYYQVLQESDKEEESQLITIVDLTTLYDRGRIAQVIQEVNQCHPATVGLDVMFEGLKGDTLGSEQLVEAICQIEKPVAAFKLKDINIETGEFLNARHSFFAPFDGLTEGYTNVQRVEMGGVVRNMSTCHVLNKDTVHSLSYQLACIYSPEVAKETLPQRQLIDYTPTHFNTVPYDSILAYRHLIENRIVLIGAMHDDSDMHYTPFGRTPGTCIQAYALQTLLEHRNTKDVNPLWTLLISFLVILMADIMQCEISHCARQSSSMFVQFFFDSAFIKNVIDFILMAVLAWLNFLVFTECNLYFNPTIMLMGVALTVEARLFYMSGIVTYREFQEKKKKKKIHKNIKK